LEVSIERISAGRGQPRRRFADDTLDELASSIKEKGILQPLVVVEASGGYELIAGERRLRAAARAGLETVPVIVKRDVSTDELVELALIENIQREDLTPLEQARAFQRLLEEHGYTQEEAARRVGKSRVAVANVIRLLGLPAQVRDLVEAGVLSEGHGRALLALPTAAAQIRTAQRIARKGLSVRETEELVRREARTATNGAEPAAVPPPSPLTELERSLMRALATKVRIRGSGKRGSIHIEFYSDAELDRLAQRLATC
jgi:ParB family chromosome partitioning protein